jgi:3-hydroxybutyrate dehydrogenase
LRLQNKVAVVTGAASGLGKEIALTYLREGAKVAIADLDFEAAQAAVKQLDKTGRLALAVGMDVTEEKQVNDGIAKVAQTFGRSSKV